MKICTIQNFCQPSVKPALPLRVCRFIFFKKFVYVLSLIMLIDSLKSPVSLAKKNIIFPIFTDTESKAQSNEVIFFSKLIIDRIWGGHQNFWLSGWQFLHSAVTLTLDRISSMPNLQHISSIQTVLNTIIINLKLSIFFFF